MKETDKGRQIITIKAKHFFILIINPLNDQITWKMNDLNSNENNSKNYWETEI